MPFEFRPNRSAGITERTMSVPDKREIPIGSAPAEKFGIREHGLSGALSIGRFVVSRWQVCGGRGTMGIQSSVGVLCLAENSNWGRNGRSKFSRQA